MLELAVIVTALMFGGTTLYSFGFAAFVFNALPAETAGPLIRRAFPHFYLFVIATSVLAGLTLVTVDAFSSSLLAFVAVTTVFARQVLMPAINAATDAAEKRRFKMLHGLSVLITLSHIALAAWVLVRLVSVS